MNSSVLAARAAARILVGSGVTSEHLMSTGRCPDSTTSRRTTGLHGSYGSGWRWQGPSENGTGGSILAAAIARCTHFECGAKGRDESDQLNERKP
jgi:hypothetical protein